MIYIKKIFLIIIIFCISIIKSNAEINDSIFATVGNKVITRSDIVTEIKIILISSAQNFSEDKIEALQKVAVRSLIKRNIKKIEIDKYDRLKFNPTDLENEVEKLAHNINIDVDTLKNTLIINEIDFSVITEILKTELLWNSLIFSLYKNKISINKEEIDEQLQLFQNKEEIQEYLISEIVIQKSNDEKIESQINKIKNLIQTEGFENVALKFSTQKSALQGGDIGWLKENIISKKLKASIINTPIGKISEPIFLPEGILIFKVRDKRKIKNIINLEEAKNQLIMNEKKKILNMHSSFHYDKLRRSVTIKYY